MKKTTPKWVQNAGVYREYRKQLIERQMIRQRRIRERAFAIFMRGTKAPSAKKLATYNNALRVYREKIVKLNQEWKAINKNG